MYLYDEGLARFASEPYTTATTVGNKYVHLTNTSVNKRNLRTNTPNTVPLHKWSLQQLNEHLGTLGVETGIIWDRTVDLIIKTLISIEPSVDRASKKVRMSAGKSCF
jgi:hypothetical protein